MRRSPHGGSWSRCYARATALRAITSMRTTGSTSRMRAIAKAARLRPWRARGRSRKSKLIWIELSFRAMLGSMKTQLIEIDDDTANVLKRRAEERGVSVPALVAELAMLEAGLAKADDGELAELDRRWKAFEAQGSATSNEEVVQWLQT